MIFEKPQKRPVLNSFLRMVAARRWGAVEEGRALNKPARFTVADLRRALKAAKASGSEWCVEVAPDGTIRIVRHAGAVGNYLQLESEEVIVL
ncbi:hypothetical protein [Lichenihabitans psoromatis]|uniref:hypothetical protein n=1 Tax=Lichenihabitans psoromatis TaxID=2528642 RepID=UPI001036801F|nr:hypothetical protein [Lichenihabitans psoromatis]